MDQVIDLSSFFKTKSQASEFSARLGLILQNIYQPGFNLEKVLSSQFNLNMKDKFITLLRDCAVNINSIGELKLFLEKIRDRISAMPVISLTLAFEPTEQTTQVLSDWFLLNKKQVLLDIKVDPSIIGGAIIAFQGKYKDFSIKPQFEQIISAVASASTANKQAHDPSPPNTAGHHSIEHMSFGR